MWRNREIQYFLIAMGSIGVAAAVVAAVILPAAALLVFAVALLLIVCSLIFTAWRYREIARLSSYVRRISGGDYSLDLRDNKEGELSVLKNDINKVTLKLMEQSSLLQKDKVRLSNAIADISHQLKTPLTSMTVMADLLSETKLDDRKREEFTHNIRVQLQRIEWLVSSLLKLSRIDAGTVQFSTERTTAAALIRKALEPVLIPMDIKEQLLSLQGEETAFLQVDINWSAEALTNILKNCVEHTPQGGKISISYKENPLFTEIIIEDNGKGIARQDLPHIFKRFYKGKNSGSDSIGIGLNLAHSIITAQNGNIEVKSTEGSGTQFTIRFYKQTV